MDLRESAGETAFRAEARHFITSHLPPDHVVETSWTQPGEDRSHEFVRRLRQWQALKFEHGWAGISWPIAYGGRGATNIEEFIFAEEEAELFSPWVASSLGYDISGPPILAMGTEEQKTHFIPRMLRGEHAWCQLWSEPEAGSDLAAVRTRAVRDGGHWVLDGQKVWSSRAHYSEYGLLVARTDPDVPKHRGLTCFLLDLSLPGVDIRPIKQANGAAHFNEVFLTAARVAQSDVLGEVGGGFQVILATLGGERSHSGAVQGTGTTFEDLLDLARRQGRTVASVDRQALVSAYIRSAVIRYLTYRIRSAVGQGHEPGPESSIMKLAFSQHASATGNLMMALIGAGGMLSDRSAPDEGRWPNEFIEQIAQRIGGGTDEIQRNTIGERVLGLPPEPRLDKLLTFRQLSTGRG